MPTNKKKITNGKNKQLKGKTTLKKNSYQPFKKHISGKPRPRPGKDSSRRLVNGRLSTQEQAATSSRRALEIKNKRALFRLKAAFVRTYQRPPINDEEFEIFKQQLEETQESPMCARQDKLTKTTKIVPQAKKSVNVNPFPLNKKIKKVKNPVPFLDLDLELAHLSDSSEELETETDEENINNKQKETNIQLKKSNQESNQESNRSKKTPNESAKWGPHLNDDQSGEDTKSMARNFQLGGSQYWQSDSELSEDFSNDAPTGASLSVKKKTLPKSSGQHRISVRRPESESNKEMLSKKMTEKHIQLSVKLLQQLDPDQKLTKPDLMILLQEHQENSDELFLIETIGFLIESLNNVEEELDCYTHERQAQEKKLNVKVKKLDPKMFQARISLDLDPDEQREPDPNVVTFVEGKKFYSGKRRDYQKVNQEKEQEMLAKFKAKKIDSKLRKKFKLYQL